MTAKPAEQAAPCLAKAERLAHLEDLQHPPGATGPSTRVFHTSKQSLSATLSTTGCYQHGTEKLIPETCTSPCPILRTFLRASVQPRQRHTHHRALVGAHWLAHPHQPLQHISAQQRPRHILQGCPSLRDLFGTEILGQTFSSFQGLGWCGWSVRNALLTHVEGGGPERQRKSGLQSILFRWCFGPAMTWVRTVLEL